MPAPPAAKKKPFNIDEVAPLVGANDPGVAAAAQDQGLEVKPQKSLATKAFQRFWGTDVHDPVEYPRLGAQLVLGIGGAYAGAEAGGAAGAAIGSAVPGIGTAIGTGVGAAIGGTVGGLSGTVAGTVAPETLMTTAEYLGVAAPETRKRLGLNDEDLKTVLEGEMLLDMVTGGGIVAARTMVRGGVKLFTGAGRSARKLADEAAMKGINLLPVQVGERTIPRGFVAVLGKFPIVAGPIRSRIHNSEKEFKAAFEALPPSIAPLATMDSVSQRVLMDAKHTFKSFSDDFAKQYEDVFRRADDAGAKVTPQSTFDKTQELLDSIKKETPAAANAKKPTSHSPAMDEVKSFLEKDVSTLWRTTKGGVTTIADQSYTQMNTVLTQIDAKIGELAKKGGAGTRQAVSRLESLKHSIALDMYQNGHGPFANAIGMEIRGLDTKYTQTMADLFETTAAKKFGTVRRGGLKEYNFDPNTRTNVDNLSEVLMRGESVGDLQDLNKLVQPRTFKELAAGILDKRINDAYTAGENGLHKLDLDKLGKNLGLDNPRGKRYLHMSKLLELAGGLKMDEVKDVIKIGGAVASVEAPNASMFLTRRITMGGLSAFVGTFTGMQAASGSVKGLGASLVGMITIMGGSNMLARMITDPTIARTFAKVLKPETKRFANKAAALRSIQMAIHGAVDAGYWTQDEGMNLYNNMKNGVEVLTKEDIRQKGPDRGPGEVPSSE